VELIASESSALLDLSMQQVSTQKYFKPSRSDLVVARLVFAGSLFQVLIGDLFAIRSPSMRKDSILGNVIANTLN